MVGGDTQPRQVHQRPKAHVRLSRHVRCDDRAHTKIAYERGINKAEGSLGQMGSRTECISRRALACVCAYPSHPRFSGMGQIRVAARKAMSGTGLWLCGVVSPEA
ncbi:hypothetical protein V8C43DRAFT_294020 [Trichoderma afarasin]